MWIYPYFCQFPYSPHLLLVKTIKQAYIINFSNLQWSNFSLIQPFKLFLNLLYSFNFTILLTPFLVWTVTCFIFSSSVVAAFCFSVTFTQSPLWTVNHYSIFCGNSATYSVSGYMKLKISINDYSDLYILCKLIKMCR